LRDALGPAPILLHHVLKLLVTSADRDPSALAPLARLDNEHRRLVRLHQPRELRLVLWQCPRGREEVERLGREAEVSVEHARRGRLATDERHAHKVVQFLQGPQCARTRVAHRRIHPIDVPRRRVFVALVRHVKGFGARGSARGRSAARIRHRLERRPIDVHSGVRPSRGDEA